MGIFGGGQKPEREFDTRVNQSVYSYPYPVVLGTAQVQQSILWTDGFTSKQVSSGGGKGLGGGKDGGYIYSADVVAALCPGPISGIADVWSGQSWFHNPYALESYTITGTGIYTPNNAAALQTDLGAGFTTSYSSSNNDLGAPTATVLSGTFTAPLRRVTYGTTLAAGEYSVNPANGEYNFNNTTDLGQSVQLSYSYLLTQISQTETDVVPSGKTIQVGGTNPFNSNFYVVYASGASEGVELTQVSSTPSATGTYEVTGSGPATYHFATGDINAEVTIAYSINDTSAVGQDEPTQLNYSLNVGELGQDPFSFLSATYPGDAFGYTGLATILYQPMDLGTSAEIQENRFEVITPDVFGAGIFDCNPVQLLGRLLTDSTWGLGVGPVPFPVQCIDNGSSGTWGAASATGGVATTNGTAFNWFAANGIFYSPVMDSQDTAASTASKWLEAGMCAAFVSEGLLKLVPYGDTSAAANGYTWTAPTSFVVALDDTQFLPSNADEDPVKITRTAAHDAWNVVQVQWDNRLNQYAPEVTQESDQAFINRWGERREDPQDWDFIHTISVATLAANLRLKRGLYIRNTYEFTVPYSYSYLEPMDIVTITTSSVWAQGLNNANLGVVDLPVRIQRIVDDPKNGLTITAEDYPWGAHQPTIYNKQQSEAEVVVDAFAEPGDSEVVMFEATNRLTGFDGDQIWIGCSGASTAYGYTNIWVSQDNSTYLKVGSTVQSARMGALALNFADGTDPDTTNSMVVHLVENCAGWDAGTDTDADNNETLTFVDDELISYSACTVTGADEITMDTYLRRGVLGSTHSAHSSGGLVMRLDGAIFKYTYDPIWRGQTLYFKFQSVNAFGNNAQPLSSLTPITFTIAGDNPGTIDASSGLVYPQYNTATFQGAWSSSVTYSIGNLVDLDASIYTCILGNTNETPPNATYWQLVGAAAQYLGAWSSSTAYVAGNQVTYLGSYFICILANTNENPVTSPTYWQQITTSETYLGTYSGSETYQPGNQVSYNGNYWICITTTIGNAPSTTSSYWTLVGTSALLIGAWSSSTAYQAGNEVYYTPSGGSQNYYVALQASTNEAPGTATDSYWYLLSNTTSIYSAASYVPTSNPLTGSDAGSSATITIANFTMQVAGFGNISVTGGSITGLSYATLYFIYYADPTISGGSVTYQYTTTPSSTISTGVDFFVGSIITPQQGQPNTIGNNDGGASAQTGVYAGMNFSTAGSYVLLGNGAVTDPYYAVQGIAGNYCAITVTGDGGTNGAGLEVSMPAGFIQSWQTATISVLAGLPTNTLSGGSPLVECFVSMGAHDWPLQGLYLGFPSPGTTVPLQYFIVTFVNPNPAFTPSDITVKFLIESGNAGSGSMELDVYSCTLLSVT